MKSHKATFALNASLVIIMLLSVISPAGVYSGGSGTETDPYQIFNSADWTELMNASADWSSHFILMNNIDLSGIPATPVGNATIPFSGVFNGTGRIISNVTIHTSMTDNVGLFGFVQRSGSDTPIYNLGLINVNITGNNRVGALAGSINSGSINNCYATGSVTGNNQVGGLAGYVENNHYGKLLQCYALCTVTGVDEIGGLVGRTRYCGSIIQCYASGSVTATGSMVGGLVGKADSIEMIHCCYATGSVQGYDDVGGLAGSFSSNYSWGTIRECYSTCSVKGNIGGVNIGGFIGLNLRNVVLSCFWDTQTSGTADGDGYRDPDPSGITGLNTAQMKTQSIFETAGWNFYGDAADWMMFAGEYPQLIWQDDHLTIVDLTDFKNLSQYWQQECLSGNPCEEFDLNADHQIDFNDLIFIIENWLEPDYIHEHINEIFMETWYDFDAPADPDDDHLGFSIKIKTDETVDAVEVTTPWDNTFSIINRPPATFQVPDVGEIENGRSYDGKEGVYIWSHVLEFSPDYTPSYSSSGWYSIDITYTNGNTAQTGFWYGIPDTTDPMPMPTQMLEITTFDNNAELTSPITVSWTPCTDSNAFGVWVNIYGNSSPYEGIWDLDVTATTLPDNPVELAPGDYELLLGYTIGYLSRTSDGIPLKVGRYSETDYNFTVVDIGE